MHVICYWLCCWCLRKESAALYACCVPPWYDALTTGSFWLTVELTFKTAEDVIAFEDAWKPLASYCRQHEHGTLSYQMARSETEPLRVVIWERYRTKSDYLDVHKTSPAFLEFRAKLTALDPVIKGHGWLESDIGYV